MNFGFTDEQELLRAEVRKFLDAKAPLEEVRKQSESEEGFDRDLWREMAGLGFVGLTIPEEYGGAGLDLVTLLVLLEEAGRTLLPSPLISTVIAAQAIQRFGSEQQRKRWLPGLADGSQIGTLALLEASDDLAPAGLQLEGKPDGDEIILGGRKLFVPDAGKADLFIVAIRRGADPEDIGLVVVEKATEGVSASDSPAMDLTKRLGGLVLDDVRVSTDSVLGGEGAGWPAVQELIDLGAALVTAESVGAAEGALTITTDFAKEREQFDSKIGRYQGVKHPLAEMYVDAESFKSLVYYGAWCFDNRPEELSRYASLAKAYATEAFVRTGIDSIQFHGAMGFTTAEDIHLYFKRSKWARPMFGDAETHYDRVVEMRGN